MAVSPRGKQGGRFFSHRDFKQTGLRLHWKIYNDIGYEPVFPFVFRDEGLDRGMGSFDVFKSHYVMKMKFGDKPLMRLEHMGCYELLFYFAELGEHFHTAELAQRLGISRHTLSGYLDVLENLNLIRRVRNGGSFARMINIVMRAPLSPTALDARRSPGFKLYRRVHEGFVQQERKGAGGARWPLVAWDYPTMIQMLQTQESRKDLASIRPAFTHAGHVINGDKKYTQMDETELTAAIHQIVREECGRRGYAYTPRLFATQMAIERITNTTNHDLDTPPARAAA